MGRKRPGKEGEPPPIELPIGPELDLHTFAPRDVASVVGEYLEQCVRRDIYEVRLIHGKGRGDLRRIVHGVLDRHRNVVAYSLSQDGNWGATIAKLKRVR